MDVADSSHFVTYSDAKSNLFSTTAYSQKDILEVNNDSLLQQSPDQSSIESSSIDWSPPESHHHSRRNTIFNISMSYLFFYFFKLNFLEQAAELALPITVDSLRSSANLPTNSIEEEKLEQVVFLSSIF